MVSVAGITFAAVLVLMTLAFLCYHRVSSSRHPRKTQVGQVLLRPRGSHHDPRARRADGASASLWSDRTTSPADSPTRTFLLASARTGAAPHHPAYYVDGPFPTNEVLESNVDTLGRPCPAYRIYGFPAYYGSPQGDGRYYDVAAPACVKCSQRSSPSSSCVGCTEHLQAAGRGCGTPAGEVFIDGPPQDRAGAVDIGRGRARPAQDRAGRVKVGREAPRDRGGGVNGGQGAPQDRAGGSGGGRGRARPPIEGTDSEPTAIQTNCGGGGGGAAWKSHDDDEVKRADVDDDDDGTYVGVEAPASSEVKRDDVRRSARPDGQSPDDDGGGTESLATTRATTTSCSTLSELDNSAADELEYDDYIPQLPGSYFQMDPHAYTLTWSQQPAADGHQQRPPPQSARTHPPQRSLSASDASIDCR